LAVKEEVLRVKEKYEQNLLKIKGVTGIGVNGSVIIYVEKLTPELAAFLPKELDGIPVRIIETGKIIPLALMQPIPVAHAIYADRTKRYRPAPGGVSCGHPEITAGTLSCRARDVRTGEILGLSNNHVIALDWGNLHVGKKGDSTLQPGPSDGGRDPTDKIGELERWVPVKLEEDNIIDAAAFFSDMLAEEVLEVGKPDRLAEPYPGMKVVKSGRTSGVTYGQILDVNATVKVSGWGVCTFKDQITVTPAILKPGDSGSWVGETDTYRTVGLGFAGSPVISVVCKGAHVERLLGVEIIPPLGYIDPVVMAGMWASLGVVSLQLKPPKRREVGMIV